DADQRLAIYAGFCGNTLAQLRDGGLEQYVRLCGESGNGEYRSVRAQGQRWNTYVVDYVSIWTIGPAGVDGNDTIRAKLSPECAGNESLGRDLRGLVASTWTLLHQRAHFLVGIVSKTKERDCGGQDAEPSKTQNYPKQHD